MYLKLKAITFFVVLVLSSSLFAGNMHGHKKKASGNHEMMQDMSKHMNSMMVMFFCLDVPLQERSGSFKFGSVKRLGSIEEAQRQETLKMPSEWRKNTTSPFK